jgi:hypothetical protein
LELIAEDSTIAGEWVRLDEPLLLARLRCTSVTELDFLIGALVDRELIRETRTGLPGTEDGQGDYGRSARTALVTIAGWEALEPVGGAGVPGVCFVAMAFDPVFNSAYEEGIRPAIESDCGLKAQRVDREEAQRQHQRLHSRRHPGPPRCSLLTSRTIGRGSILKRVSRWR